MTSEQAEYVRRLVKWCRMAQKSYERTRSSEDLQKTKKAEADLDTYLEKLEKEEQPKLF